MADIHPTSIIDPQATLADDVTIGPWCVIQGQVTIGPGCVLMERVTLKGPLTLGAHNIIYPNCCLGLEPQDRKFDPNQPGVGTVIGQGNIFREGFTLHRATLDVPTTVGNHNMFMANSHIAHDCMVGSQCTLANSALLAGHVTLGDQVIMSGNTAVHQFCRVGRLAMIGVNQCAIEDLPPFCVIARSRCITGLNLVGLRRSGSRDSINPLKKTFDLFFRDRHAKPTALAMFDARQISDPLCLELAEFIRQPSRRGITKADRYAEETGV